MKEPAALLLISFLVATAITYVTTSPSTTSLPATSEKYKPTHSASFSTTKRIVNEIDDHEATTASPKKSIRIKADDYMKNFMNPKNVLMQEIFSLREENSNSKIQDEVAETFKAEARRQPYKSTLRPSLVNTGSSALNDTSEARVLKRPFDDIPYDDVLSDDEDDEDDDDDDYDDEDEEDDLDDDEEVMTQCPDYCRCVGQYAAATSATCTKLIEDQSFGSGIAHLKIENAGEIRLGPHAFRALGLQQLETIAIIDTRIVELDRTAFDDLKVLFAVNLTRNALQDIHPHIFQNNSQLSLLTISGNPLRHTQYLKPAKHYLLDAPSITEIDFSNNGIPRLPRMAFSKMQNLAYISLKGNRIKEIDPASLNSLDSLVELDLSNNLLNELPIDLFSKNEVETLRISGNNLSTLAVIHGLKLTVLDAANNNIRVIAKDDLVGLSQLEKLIVRSNDMKRIHQHAFTDLDQMTFLDISDNKLSSWTEHHLRNNARLQVLIMSDNPLLEALPVFKTVGYEYDAFSVYRFDCANCGLYFLQEGTFDQMPALNILNLARNRLVGLPNGLMKHLTSLRDFDLSDNRIANLDANMFRGAESLTKLNLAGNPLVTLQVTPFLMTPSLLRLDVSRCALERVWSEARVPLKSLRFLSVRGNLLRRITLEELKATPKLFGLDLYLNPLECDDEFSAAVQWLTNHGIQPEETPALMNYHTEELMDVKGVSQWTELAKIVCDGIEDGPPSRQFPRKGSKPKEVLPGLDILGESEGKQIDNDENLLHMQLDHGFRMNEEAENAWTLQDQDYETMKSLENRPWYSGALWPVIAMVVATLIVLLLVAQIAICLAKRRGRGPVIRPPMILRQGLIDNKNCGLVYKPLQEEIATPHMPKRGSFYSSSTFHYDKIVPESV